VVLARLIRALDALAGISSFTAAAATQERVSYTISPIFTAGGLSEVEITVRLAASANGRTVIDLPDRFGGVADHWRYLSDFHAEGGNCSALVSSSA